jgi:histidyl-tRNA synthetase
MYLFEDRGGRKVAVRPEGTASVMRYVALKGQDAQDARLYYIGPMFRCERPQAGRKRQFHQIGAEAIGTASPAADAEIIALQVHFLRELGLGGATIRINTLGTPEDRAAVTAGLRAALVPQAERLCEDCRRRLDTNVLRTLDCKNESCRAILDALPPVTGWMADASRTYFADVQNLLRGLGIDFTVSPALVRGFDYYMHTVWEIAHPALGAQDALCGGGRYRIEMGGRTVEGVGYAMGFERLIMAIEKENPAASSERGPSPVWLVSFGSAALAENLKLMQTLRQRGLRAGMDLSGRSMKAQMRAAGREGAQFVIIRGDQELADGTFQFKDMQAGTQVSLALPELLDRVSPR